MRYGVDDVAARYYSPADDATYVTPSRFRRLGREKQKEYMVHWFQGLFCDPAHETPYIGNEGGYQYVWGGPYSASEELYEEFGLIATEEAILEAIDEIESDGIVEWAPSDNHPDQIARRDEALAEAEWIDQEIAADPYGVFMESYRQSVELLGDHGDDNGNSLINRMVFAQQVSALEAYLGDTLLRNITNAPVKMKGLLTEDKDLAAQRVSLADIANNADIVLKRVTAYLNAVPYHNLPRVDFFYFTVLGVRVLRGDEENAKLLKAIKYRHDCVHRNGIDRDGRRLTVFTRAYVQEIADLMRDLVELIEREIQSLEELPF
jgi:hypothetical protein